MASLRLWFARMCGLVSRRRSDADLADELNGHLDAHIADNLRAGMAYDEACRHASLKLGGLAMTTDSYREQRSLPWLEHVARDARVVAAVRGAVAGIDPNIALADVRTLQAILDRASDQMAFTMVLIAIAANVALVLGVIGIYGVMSYIVTQRTGEIGVRLALGAEPARVAGMVLRQGGGVAIAGVAVGLVAALAGGRLMASLVYGVSTRDPGVFAAATLILLSVALLACWLPARRAAAVDPLVALRSE